jgi:hypothetical protein
VTRAWAHVTAFLGSGVTLGFLSSPSESEG